MGSYSINYLVHNLFDTKNKRNLNVPSSVYLVKNRQSEVRSEWCKAAGIGGGKSSISTLFISGSVGEVLVSSYSLDRLGKGVGTAEGKDNVA